MFGRALLRSLRIHVVPAAVRGAGARPVPLQVEPDAASDGAVGSPSPPSGARTRSSTRRGAAPGVTLPALKSPARLPFVRESRYSHLATPTHIRERRAALAAARAKPTSFFDENGCDSSAEGGSAGSASPQRRRSGGGRTSPTRVSPTRASPAPGGLRWA